MALRLEKFLFFLELEIGGISFSHKFMDFLKLKKNLFTGVVISWIQIALNIGYVFGILRLFFQAAFLNCNPKNFQKILKSVKKAIDHPINYCEYGKTREFENY